MIGKGKNVRLSQLLACKGWVRVRNNLWHGLLPMNAFCYQHYVYKWTVMSIADLSFCAVDFAFGSTLLGHYHSCTSSCLSDLAKILQGEVLTYRYQCRADGASWYLFNTRLTRCKGRKRSKGQDLREENLLNRPGSNEAQRHRDIHSGSGAAQECHHFPATGCLHSYLTRKKTHSKCVFDFKGTNIVCLSVVVVYLIPMQYFSSLSHIAHFVPPSPLWWVWWHGDIEAVL